MNTAVIKRAILPLLFVVSFVILPVVPTRVVAQSSPETREELLATIARLLSIVEELRALIAAKQALESATPVIPEFTRDLTLGDTGEDVRRLQIFLNRDPDTRVALTGPGSLGQETAFFGELTQNAVKRFQKKHAGPILKLVGYVVLSGNWDKQTRERANEIIRGDADEEKPSGSGKRSAGSSHGGGGGGGGGSSDPDPEPENEAPIAGAGVNIIITLPGDASLSGSATDDGLPDGTLTYEWSKVSGPGTVTFGDDADPTTTAAFSAPGTYVLRLTVRDGDLSDSDELTVTVNPEPEPENEAPVANAGTDATLTLPESATLSGSATDDGQPDGVLEYEWSKVSGPGTVTFGDDTDPTTTALFSVAGTYVLRLTVDDGDLTDTDDMTIVVEEGDTVFEADYYVATDGDDSNPGTFEEPFRTIGHGADQLVAGDTLYIRDGVYQEYLNWDDHFNAKGTEGNPITVAGYPGETAIIDGSHRADEYDDDTNPSAPQLIYLRDADWYVFENLVLRNSAGRGFDLGDVDDNVGTTDNTIIRNVVVYNNHGDGIHIKGNNNLVENSISYGNNSILNGGDSADGLKIDYGNGNIIRRFVAYGNSDDGIDLWDSTNTLVEFTAAFSNGIGESGNGMGFKLSNGSRNNAGSTIRFSIGFSNRGFNFTDNGGGGLTAYNNTSWNAGDDGFVFRGRLNQTQHVLRNNISYQDPDGVLIDIKTDTGGGTLPDHEFNSWNLGISDPGFESLVPPESPASWEDFVNSDFLKLVLGSISIDAGEDVGLEYLGDAPDLGAFERE